MQSVGGYREQGREIDIKIGTLELRSYGGCHEVVDPFCSLVARLLPGVQTQVFSHRIES